MAKQLVNPVERHVEKGVLGLAGLVLIWSIATYLVSSPNQLEIGGEFVTPDTIDEKVARKAASVRDRARNAQPELAQPEKLFPEFEGSLNPFATEGIAVTLPVSVTPGPDVPIIDPPEVVEGDSSLVTVVATSAPKAIHGRTTFEIDGQEQALNWVTLSAVFEVKQQRAEQSREYGAARKDVVFGPVQLQRRARREDGSWSEGDWNVVVASPAGSPPPLPAVSLEREGDRVVVPGKDLAAVDQFFSKLREPILQLSLIRPMMPDYVSGDLWTIPIITSERDVLVGDDYYINRDKPPAANPANRYVVDDGRAQAVVVKVTPEQILAKAEALLATAWPNKSTEAAVDAYNLALEVEENETLSRALRKKGTELTNRALQRESDIKRWLKRNRAAAGSAAETEEKEREAPDTQQIWVHDAKPDSVKSGMTYQYRLRPLLFNRLAGSPDKFREKADATAIFVPGEWTDPVEIAIEPDRVFFVNSEDSRNHQIGVEFYQWFEGVWVQSRRFKYGVGDSLEGSSRCDVPSLTGDTLFDTTPVDFAADATVVDIDFNRPFRERKKGKGRRGVRFTAPKPACSVVFADSAGRLHERFVLSDKGNPNKKAYNDRKYRPPRGD